MNALVVHESYFGNTAAIAEAIAVGLRSKGVTVTVTEAASAPELDGIELVVIGAPTHAFSLPRAESRLEAAEKWGGTLASTGVNEWLEQLVPTSPLQAAAFDTEMATRFSGSAAKGIEKRLRRQKIDVMAREGFIVESREGPLAEGELDRAEQWGASLARRGAASN